MKWPLFPDIVVLVQLGSVLFGTVFAAPLLSSLSPASRRRGFVCMAVGSLFALAATASAGLWVLACANAFWVVSSLRGWWLLTAEQTKTLQAIGDAMPSITPQAVSNALDSVSDAIVETGQAAVDVLQGDNRPPDAA